MSTTHRGARRSAFLFIAAFGVASVSCGGGGDGSTGPGGGGSAAVATVELSPSSPAIVIGGTSQLTATLKDVSGNVLTGRTVEWKSDADLVASVSPSGLVTSKSIGTANITATAEGKSATTKVTVTPVPVASVAVTPPTSSLVVGGTVQLSATTKDEAGNVLTGRSVDWTTSDQTVATVSTTGVVTAVAIGSATITATSETKTGTAAITVTVAPVATVAVAPSSVSILQGATTTLTATTSDASGRVLTGRSVSWSSSDQTKATVDQNGVVTGVSYGQVTITATSEEKTGTATVKVGDGTAPVLVGLTIVPSPVDVTASDKIVTFTAHITDAGGSGTTQFALTATAPDGPFASCGSTTLDSGTAADGFWKCSVTIPVGADPGDWQLLVLVSDAGFASRTYNASELTAAALPGSFHVASNWDMTPPAFQSLTVPSPVSLASGAQTVTVSAHLTDNRSGVARFDFTATAPSGRLVSCAAVAPASGDPLNGTWSCGLAFPADAEAGSWKITVRATDRAFRYQTYGPQPDDGTIPFPAGYPTSITVTR